MTAERRRAANRANARLSTGPRTAAGKARVKQNALHHGLNVKVADDPLLTEGVERLARAICDGAPRGGGRPAEFAYLARRVAEAQVDLMRVRRARHAMMTGALDNPRYRSPRYLRRQIATLVAVGKLLVRGIAVPDDMRKAAFGRPQGALKFALVIADLAHELARFERYERRALSRRKAAVAAFDAACTQDAPALIELPAMAVPREEQARRWRNKATVPRVPVVPKAMACDPQSSPLPSRERSAAKRPGEGAGRESEPVERPLTPTLSRKGRGSRRAVPAAIVLPDRAAPGWRNKATATTARAAAGMVRARGDRPTVSYREAAFHACEPLDVDRPLRLDLPRDGPHIGRAQQAHRTAPFGWRKAQRACAYWAPAQVLRPPPRYSARLNAVHRDCLQRVAPEWISPWPKARHFLLWCRHEAAVPGADRAIGRCELAIQV